MVARTASLVAVVAVVVAALLVAEAEATKHARKQLAGPPSEFARHALPSPQGQAVTARSALYYVGLNPSLQTREDGENDLVWTWERSIQIDSPKSVSLSLFTPAAPVLFMHLYDPNGKRVHLPSADKVFWENGDEHDTGKMFDIKNPTPGTYTLKVIGLQFPTGVDGQAALNACDCIVPKGAKPATNETLEALMPQKQSRQGRHGLLMLWNNATESAWTHLTTYDAKVGEEVGLIARMVDSTVGANAIPDVVNQATLEVVYPDGTIHSDAMHDDGLHGDGEPDDGEFAGSFKPTMPGSFNVQAHLVGTNDDGAPFVRTSQHIIRVVDSNLALTGHVTGSIDKANSRMTINVNAMGHATDSIYRLYSQVWGTGADGKAVPVAWVSTLVDGAAWMALELDLKWVAQAKATAPYTLRDVLVQDIETMDPLVVVNDPLNIIIASEHERYINATVDHLIRNKLADEITLEMRQGVAPRHIAELRSNGSAVESKVMMVHGYCASTNPWETNAQYLDNAVFPLRADASMRTDEFANFVLDYAESNGINKFSCIGFSQGGMVCTHIYNYYFSAMDGFGPDDGRVVQTLATPMQGNTGASTGSALIDLFGGCPANEDLTKEAAALWLTGITTETASQVYMITTQYETSWVNGYCSLVMNLVLQSHNDGATERDLAPLPGATLVTHDFGWCHTVDSKYPVSWSNVEYIKYLNEHAAR
eukprot:m.476993 g.476993  ORF g.476993 m.476993 type:complete len:707 (+) comp20716_c0_seq1:203-2323(+)